MKRIAILASGSGTNAENIAKIFNQGSRIRVGLVVTNRKNAGVVDRMAPLDVPVVYVPNSVWDNTPTEVVELLRGHDIDLVVLAGFMHFVAPEIVEAYRGRILNIHPSLLPAYGGKGMWGHHVHEAVVAAGETKSGVTVHYVTEEMDKGEILLQQSVDVVPDDTAETLEAKIHPIEYQLYPRAIVKAVERLEASENEDDDNAEGRDAEFEESQDAAGRPDDVPPPTPEEQWARTLKINYDPSHTAPPAMESAASMLEAPQSAPQPAAQATHQEPMPSTFMLWSVLATIFCCIPTGIVAIVMSARVSSRFYKGDLAGARRASELAQIWIVASIVLGVIYMVVWLPVMLLSETVA